VNVVRIVAAALALASLEPPTEIQLWDPGVNATDYGDHRWTERSAREVLGEYKARGNLLSLDIEHNGAFEPDPQKPPPVKAGYAALELRSGAPFLKFDWSDEGARQIRSGERRYLSPEYDVDKRTGEIVRLVRVSLVAEPATHHARLLASATRVRANEGGRMDPEQVKAALDALVAKDAEKAMQILQAMIAQAAGGAVPAQPAEAMAAAPAATPPAAEDDKDKEKVAAAAPATPAAPATAPGRVAAAAPSIAPVISLAKRIDDIERDRLLEKHGARLPESQRVWASKQPLDVVKGLLEASPEPTTPVRAATPTRGEGQGKPGSSLPAEEKAELDRRMGLTRVVAGVRREGHALKFGVLTAEDAKRIQAARTRKEA